MNDLMSDNPNGVADIIAGIGIAQGVIFKMLLLSGAITAEQAISHLENEMHRLEQLNASDELKMATDRLLCFAAGSIKQIDTPAMNE